MDDVFMLFVVAGVGGFGFGSFASSIFTYLIAVRLTAQNIIMAESISENTKAISKLADTIASFGE